MPWWIWPVLDSSVWQIYGHIHPFYANLVHDRNHPSLCFILVQATMPWWIWPVSDTSIWLIYGHIHPFLHFILLHDRNHPSLRFIFVQATMPWWIWPVLDTSTQKISQSGTHTNCRRQGQTNPGQKEYFSSSFEWRISYFRNLNIIFSPLTTRNW